MKKTLVILLLFMFTLTGWANAAPVNPYSQGFIEGYLQQINLEAAAATTAASLDIEDYSGNIYNLPVASTAEFIIDGIPVKLADFKAGMEIYAELQGKSIISLEGYSTAQLGYISPGSKVRKGIITSIDRDQLQLQLSTGETTTYYTSPITLVSRNGVSTTLSSLYVGDQVKCFFDAMDTDIISQIMIEGKSILVKDVYLGSLKIVDGIENAVVLGDIKVLRNGEWTDYAPSLKVYYNSEVPVYIGGQLISYQNLKYYVGKTVYMATRDFFGREQIEKMVLKNQSEANYSEQIENINWYTDALELSNNKNIAFNEGTIIIRNGRLVDKSALNTQTDALILADGRGDRAMADVISIYNEDVNNSNIGGNYVYYGRLDQIVPNSVWIKRFYILDENSWESFNDEKELYYDNDTGIFDIEEGEYITPREFYSRDYAVDEDSDRVSDNDLDDWYGYIYTDGDRIAALAVQKDRDSLSGQRITNGMVAGIENDALVGWTISIRDSKDWSNLHERWMARNTNLRVNLGRTLIIKDGRIILPEELTPGDRIYMVRDDFRAKVLLVK